MADLVPSDTLNDVHSFQRIDNHPIDLFFSSVHTHLPIFCEQLPACSRFSNPQTSPSHLLLYNTINLKLNTSLFHYKNIKIGLTSGHNRWLDAGDVGGGVTGTTVPLLILSRSSCSSSILSRPDSTAS